MNYLPRPAARRLRSGLSQFTPELDSSRSSRRSSALLITLTLLALVTILVIAFLGLASQDLKSTNYYVRAQQADQIARGGLEFVVGNLQGEITDAALSLNVGTVQSPFYVPVAPANTFPQRMVPLGSASTNIILNSASASFYGGGSASPTMASTIPSTNASINNQVVTVAAWNKPLLVPTSTAANIPVPNWIFMTRNGPTATTLTPTTVSSTVGPNLGYTTGVIGRYAFMVYDTSGLLDINVAGYNTNQPSMATNAPGKGILTYADLTQLPGIAVADATNLVSFRNAVSQTNYPLALTNTSGSSLLSNGFMQVYTPSGGGLGDSTFLSRQELIQYAYLTNPAPTMPNANWIAALPYLTTFSREANGPTWGPTVNFASPYNYQNSANINANIYTVKVPASWVGAGTRNNGAAWFAGEPLVKYRFPLDKLALLQSVGTTYSFADWTANKDNIQTNIQKYFGLDLVSDSNGLYRHWQYPTASTTYLHTGGNVLSLTQVAALTKPREADFFELLQAGILSGSLGGWGRGDGSQNPTDYDIKTTIHVMRIGANIINQWNSDSYPVTITYAINANASPDSVDVYGVADLPYITQMFVKGYSPNGDLTVPVLPYIYFQVWNPHQAPSAYNVANYPSKLRIVPFTFYGDSTKTVSYSDNYSLFIAAPLPNYSSGTFKWFYNPALGYTAVNGTNSAGSTNFFGTSTTFGGGYENDPAAGLMYTPFNPYTDYREPGLMVGTPHPGLNVSSGTPPVWSPGSSLGGGSPSGQVAAISLPAIPSFPPVGQYAGTIPGKYNGNANSTHVPWIANYGMTNAWRFGFASQTVFAQQFMDANNSWHTYATFEGVDGKTAACLTSYNGWNTSGWWVPTIASSPNDASFVKSDPRTQRFGPGDIPQASSQSGSGVPVVSGPTTNAASPPLLNPDSTLAHIAWNIYLGAPFTNTPPNTSTPYRMDYWAVNNQNNAIQGPYFTNAVSVNSPYLADLDGTERGGDSAYAYSTSASGWGNNPEVPGALFPTVALPARPVMLNHPFRSVGDLGYAYRDDPYRTLDFMTPASADAGLLDLFGLSEAPVVAGRINPNTPYPQVIASLVSGATQSSLTNSIGPVATVPASVAQLIGQKFVSLSSSSPITNRASVVTGGAVSNIIYSSYFTGNGTPSLVKTEGESVVRSLAESSNTRTWNLLIDVIGQSGHFINNSNPLSSGGTDNFVVEGERRYWLHVAIDRYTGKIIDQQLELVDQ